MLSVFLLHIIISASALLSGFLFYTYLNKFSVENNYKPLIVYLISGLVVISVLYQLLILFFPLNFYLKNTLWPILLTGGVASRKKCAGYLQYLAGKLQQCNWPLLALIISAWFMIVLISAGPVIMDDTQSYHIQIIKWTQEYGTVPGLVNLHERFGFNSAWLTLISVFAPSKNVHNYYAVMNGLLSLWLCAYLFIGLSKSSDPKTAGADTTNPGGLLLILFFAIVCWPLVRGNAANANYDFVTTFVVIVLFIELWNKRMDFDSGVCFSEELLLWPFFLFTVRVTNFPLLLLSLFACLHLIRLKKIRLLYSIGAICILLVSAFAVRNVILSGYLFYPVYQIDLFSFDWKADPAITRQLTTFIKYFNRVPSLPIEETQKLSGISWIPAWFLQMQWYDKLIVLTGLSGFTFAVSNMKKYGGISSAAVLFIPVLLFQLIAWLIIAPDTRFAYGPLLVGSYLLTLPFEQQTTILFSKKVIMLICVALVSVILLYSSFRLIKYPEYRNFFAPALLPSPPVHTTRLNNIELRVPEKILDNWNARCYGTDLPCLYIIQPGLRARSNKIADGFRIER